MAYLEGGEDGVVTCERQPRGTGERAVRVDPLERVAQAVALLALLALPAEAAQRVRLVDVRTWPTKRHAKSITGNHFNN